LPAIERVDVPVTGGTLATFRLGTAGPPVLAVHGATANSHCWLALARSLGDSATLIAPDLRGRGRSNGLGPPYGMAAHVADMLAVLDRFDVERVVTVGHSLGASIVAGLGADHPERTREVIMIDGGLTVTRDECGDPEAFLDAVMAPVLARLRLEFPTNHAYQDWWRAHPALRDGEVSDVDVCAHADHDLVGEPPALHSSISEASVRADTADLFESGKAAGRLTVPAKLVYAPRQRLTGPSPMPPVEVVEAWASATPNRAAIQIPDCNHQTIVMGASGARAVAAIVREALTAANP
jgi:pimeloyl-ACP methyl ester carboxylesterase